MTSFLRVQSQLNAILFRILGAVPASSLSELRRLKSSPGLFLQQTGILASCLWTHSGQPIWLLMFSEFGAVCFRKPGGEYWWAWGSLDLGLSLSGWHFPGTYHLLLPIHQAAQITRSLLSQRALEHRLISSCPIAFPLVLEQLNTLAYLPLEIFFFLQVMPGCSW